MRFVDDIHATVGDKGQAIVICTFLNEQHPNIKFTIEHEVKNRLPFLDTCVIRTVNGYKTTVYRKKTFTGVYLNWNSLTARRYKIGLIRCLAERIWRTVSDTCERMTELQRLRTILARNEYPASVIECTLKRFMEKKSRVVGSNEKSEDSRPTKRFLKLPYVSRKCEDYAFRLKSWWKLTTNRLSLTWHFRHQ